VGESFCPACLEQHRRASTQVRNAVLAGLVMIAIVMVVMLLALPHPQCHSGPSGATICR
jgi:hypothetical protein